MHSEPGYITEKQAIQTRLRRVEGQVRGLQRLVDEDTRRTLTEASEAIARLVRA